MNHSFNIEIAAKYNIEKAILLENFAFWVAKNSANRINIHDGKAYTYNTAEAFAKLFPYIKPRKIAQLLREMEDDGLIISRQFGGRERTKSYTLTDYAWGLLSVNVQDSVSSNIQKLDNGTSENLILESQKSVCCLNTDINTDIKPNINIGTTAPKAKKPPLIDREPANDIEKVEKAYLLNYRKLYNSGIVKTATPVINWGQSRALTKKAIETYGLETILDAVQKSVDYDFCVQKGYTLTTILSAGCLANLINGNGWKKGTSINAFDKLDGAVRVDF